MTQAITNLLSARLFQRLKDAVRDSNRILREHARNLPKLYGVNQRGQFSRPMENVLDEAGDLLEHSGRIYSHGNNIVMEKDRGEHGRILTIATDGCLERAATSRVANIFICEQASLNKDVPPIQFAPPSALLQVVVNNEPILENIPRIALYSKRPCFDSDFNYCNGGDEGWHQDVGYLVHGPAIDPVIPEPPSGDVVDNIPPTIRRLLQSFLLKSLVDLVNVIGVLLTGILIGRFIEKGKALTLLDGNQPSVGKTLFARTVGVVMDGFEPDAIRYNPNDEELEKRLCSGLRAKPSSVVLIDNAKVRGGSEVSSLVIEAQCVAPEVSLRILGTSSIYSRPNSLLWFLTMNGTKVSDDLMARGLPVQFECEGDPANHDFGGFDPISFARDNRNRILAELAGMVEYWTLQGRPAGTCRHRLQDWATVIGGILDSVGLTGFLENANEANATFNTQLEAVGTLAEAALKSSNVDVLVQLDGTDQDVPGLLASDLHQLFAAAGVMSAELESSKSTRSKSTKIGHFLGKYVDREVPIEHDGRTGLAKLRCSKKRANKRYYYFSINFDEGNGRLDSGCRNDNRLPPPGFSSGVECQSSDLLVSGSRTPFETPADVPGNREEW